MPEPAASRGESGGGKAKNRLLGIAWPVVRTLALAWLVILLLRVWFEESLIFPARKFPHGNWEPVGLRQEEAEFQAADGTPLHGWYAAAENPRAVILFFHGNAENVADNAWLLQMSREELGASMLVFDYRGYGKSGGAPTERGILEDSRAARAWLAQRAGGPESEIVLWGRSIGGGFAVDLAARDGARGLILESTFSSLPEVAAPQFPWLPVKSLMRTRLDSRSKIGEYRGPLLQCHGTNDRVVPYPLGRKLFEAAAGPKTFIDLEGADHNDGYPEAWYAEVERFLATLPTAD